MRRYALRDDQWDRIKDTLPAMMIDATIVRAHQHSAGAQKKTVRKPSDDPAAD